MKVVLSLFSASACGGGGGVLFITVTSSRDIILANLPVHHLFVLWVLAKK